MKKQQILFCGLILLLLACSKNTNTVEEIDKTEEAESDNLEVEKEEKVILETDFYTQPSSYAVVKNLVTDYNVDNSFATDDSQKVQTAVDDITSLGGGKLIIPEGNYSFSEIKMKSNVHIVISYKAVIRPSLRGDDKNFKIFSFGNDNNKIENVSITSDSNEEKFTVDLRYGDNRNVGVFGFGYVENFLISGVSVLDDLTKFSSFTFGISEYNGGWQFSKNGVIKNATTSGSHYGYGLVQAQALKNTLFKNIDGEGGVTLRLETGVASMNNLQIGGVFDIFGDHIGGTDGNAAVMISPHAMQCGKVYIQNVTSNGCGLGVRIGGGYVSNKYTTPGLTDGTFERVELKNIRVTFGNKAQLKPKHYKYMPCELRDQISTTPITDEEDTFYGPSVAGMLSTANFPVIFSEDEDLEAVGFVEGYEFVGDNDAIENCN